MGKAVRWGLIFVIAIGFIWWLTLEEAITVTVIHAKTGKVEATISNTRSGTVTACQRAKLSLPIGGLIEHLHVVEGQLVKQNDVLLALWNKDKQALLAESNAKANALKLSADSMCTAARHDAKEAKRQQALFKQKLSSQDALDAALAKSESAHSNCLAAKANHDAMISMVGVVESQLEQTYLKAPFDGIVAEVTGEVGEYTTPSPPGVATPPAIDLLTHECHYITAPIDEIDAADIKIDMPVRISIDAFKNLVFKGRVQRISPYVQDHEKQARTVTIEVSLDEHSSPHLLAGYSADVEVITDVKDDVLYLPSDVIIEKQYVLIVNAQGIIEKRPVTIGLSNWNDTEIVSGIDLDAQVVSSIGMLGVEPGIAVKIGLENGK